MDTCQRCGEVRDASAPSALAWACERDVDGRIGWLCPECARRHVRDIEAKLPHEWW